MKMTDKRELRDRELEALFSAARAAEPDPSEALVARIVADAEAEADRREAAAAAVADRPRRAGLRATLAAVFGGWPSLAGLSAAALAGLLVGYVAPDTLQTVSGGYLGGEDSSAYGIEDLADPGLDYADILGEG